jgi:hypothetical protein
MFVDKAFGDASLPRPQCLGVANLVAAIGALRGARRAEVLGEGRFELLRDQHERPPLLHEERRMLLDVLERERRERLEAQKRVKQLMREHPHLELERELQRLTEELGLEREGLTHNRRERQRLGEELERERLGSPRGSAGMSNALSETLGSCCTYSRCCSRLSRLRRRAYGQKPLKKQ